MAGVIIEVDTQQLKRDQHLISEKLLDVRKKLTDVYSQMAELDAMWDGPASEAFVAQFSSDRRYFENLCKEVDMLVICLKRARLAYENCESQVDSAVDAIKI